MRKCYQVWILTDDLQKMNEKNEKLVEIKMLETENRGVAVWFALNYPFERIENTLIRVENVNVKKNGDEECVDIVLEKQNEE